MRADPRFCPSCPHPLQCFWIFLIFFGAPANMDYYSVPSQCDYFEAHSQLCCVPDAAPACLQSQGGYYLVGAF